jgi:hypothetical protein
MDSADTKTVNVIKGTAATTSTTIIIIRIVLLVLPSVIRNILVYRNCENGNDPLERQKTAAYYCCSINHGSIQIIDCETSK